MKYQITVTEITPSKESSYPDKENIYEQTIETDNFNLKGIIDAVNNQPQPTESKGIPQE